MLFARGDALAEGTSRLGGAGVDSNYLAAVLVASIVLALAVASIRSLPTAARVAACAGLGQAVGTELFAGGQGPEVSVLLLLGPCQVERVAAEAGVGADDDADAAGDSGELLDGDRVGQRVEPGASDLLRVRNAQQTQRCRLADDLVRELTLGFELVDHRGDPPLGEVPDRPANLLVLPGEREIHG